MRNTRFTRTLDEDLLIVPLCEGEPLPDCLQEVDRALEGGVRYNLEKEKFSGKCHEWVSMTTNGKYTIPKILVIGIGERQKLTPVLLKEVGGRLAVHLAEQRADAVALDSSCLNPEDTSYIALGIWLRRWNFDKYNNEKSKPFTLHMMGDAEKLHNSQSLYQGIALARELTIEPANTLYPNAFAERCKMLSEQGVSVKIYDEHQLERMGARALLAVGAGSMHAPRLVTLQWNGTHSNSPPIVMVGKGVCFDSGGINIKTTEHITYMKMDKAAAATVVGTIYSLALMKAPVNVVGIIGLAENMPDGRALKPGDVIRMHSGKTVEVVDTDNEGRLILADCLSFAQEMFNPAALVDLGTLTLETFGALAGEYAGLFCEDEKLSHEMIAAGKRSGEKLWPLPMGEPFAKQIVSSIADIKNMGILGYGESSACAEFLKCFIRPGTPWAHLDIAGVAWSAEDQTLSAKGATGFGVRLLSNWILHRNTNI